MSLKIPQPSFGLISPASRNLSTNCSNLNNLGPVFTKPKADRTKQDIEIAVNALKGLSFFSSMREHQIDLEQLLVECLNVMECESFKAGETVFNYKDKASKFYIILKGSVNIYVPKTEEEYKKDILTLENFIQKKIQTLQKKVSFRMEEPSILVTLANEKSNKTRLSQAENLLSTFRSHCDKTKLDTLKTLLNLQDFQKNHEELTSKFKRIKTIGAGTYFGEIALSMDCPRSATITACSDLLVATLSRNDYKKTLRHFEKSFRQKMDFFARVTNLGPEEPFDIAKFCYGFKERKYAYGQKIFAQGETPQELLIIKNGEVQVSVNSAPEKAEVFEQCPVGKRKKSSNQKLVNLGPYNFLGEKDALALKSYSTSATSMSSNTTLYVLPLQDFEALKECYSFVFDKVLAQHEVKEAYFESRIENINLVKKDADPASPKKPARLSRSLTKPDLTQIHSLKFFTKKMNQITLPKLNDSPNKKIVVKKLDNSPLFSPEAKENPSELHLSEYNLGISLSHRNPSKQKPAFKRGSTLTYGEQVPKQTTQEKLTFEAYFHSNELNKDPSNFAKLLQKFSESKEKEEKGTKSEPTDSVVNSPQLTFSKKTFFKGKNRNSDFLIRTAQGSFFSDSDSDTEPIQVSQKAKNIRLSMFSQLDNKFPL